MEDVRSVITSAIQGIYDAMDSEGMFPSHPCRGCGKELNADGDHPAELYAGTYTGLCYPCTSLSSFITHKLPDGAQCWSYPPSCPSWRRDRETYYGYEGCSDCDGTGVSGERYANWSRQRDRCDSCSKRLYAREKRNSIAFLRAVAAGIETVQLLDAETPYHAVKAAAVDVIVDARSWFADDPPEWRPCVSLDSELLHQGLTDAKLQGLKRPETIVKKVVAALRAAADEREAKLNGEA